MDPPRAPPDPASAGPMALAPLAAYAAELAETFVALSCDLALVIDAGGCILKIAQDDARPIISPQWLGRRWVDSTCDDSRQKAERLLAEVAASGVASGREINHPARAGAAGYAGANADSVCVNYSGAHLGPAGPVLAIGHDLRRQSDWQQRFLAAQHTLEHGYWQSFAAVLRAGKPDAAAAALAAAVDDLCARIGGEPLPDLLQQVRRLAEVHFVTRAIERIGDADAVARALDASERPTPPRQPH